MITVEQSKKSVELMLKFYNTFRKNPISLEEFKKQHEREADEKCPELIEILKK